MKNNKLLSYYKLRKLIDQNKCILNDKTLDYLESLLKSEISILNNHIYDPLKCYFLNELELFRSLVLYNLYNTSLKLIDNNSIRLVDQNIIVNESFDKLSFDVIIDDSCFNIFLLDYSDVPNITLYQSNSSLEQAYFVPYAREEILNRFLCKNDLKISDFDNEIDSLGNNYKVKKYCYSNIYIK